MTGNRKSRPSVVTAQARRDFQKNLSILKKRGLIAKGHDIRKQRITRHYKSKIKKFADVIEGTSYPVKVSPDIYKTYKAGGNYRLANHRVIVPTEPGAIAEAKRGQYIERTTRVGNAMIEEVLLPTKATNIFEFLAEAKSNPAKFQSMLGPGWQKEEGKRWAFKFYGRNSYETYYNIDQLAEELEKYRTVVGSKDEAEAKLIWENLVLYRISPHAIWAHSPENRRKRKKHRKAPGEYVQRVFMTPEEKAEAARLKSIRDRAKYKAKATVSQLDRLREKERTRKAAQRARKRANGFKIN